MGHNVNQAYSIISRIRQGHPESNIIILHCAIVQVLLASKLEQRACDNSEQELDLKEKKPA